MADYVMFRGRRACVCLAAWLPVFEAELKRLGVINERIDIAQLTGGAAASGGTHTQGGAFDIWQCNATTIRIARQMGADASWKRTPAQGFSYHTHGVLRGCPHNSPARYQITSSSYGVDHVKNGLASGGRDDGPRPLSKRTWKQGIAWAKARQTPPFALRIATMNLPAEDKLPNGAARIKRASYILRSAKPDIIGWNELQPIKKAGISSDFAHDVDAALGTNWYLVKPTRAHNENYISYRGDRFELVHQYDDSILEAPTGGRHITRAVFKHKASGQVFAVGQTHLVDGSTAAHVRDRVAQAADAVTSMKAVSAKHGNCPIIIQGDFNTTDVLPAFTSWKRTREKADTSSTRNATTYTNYAKTKPSTNYADWAIDQQEVTPDLYVIGYTVIRDMDDDGNFNQPRPSDHSAVISSLELA